jgi:hypothetical protein
VMLYRFEELQGPRCLARVVADLDEVVEANGVCPTLLAAAVAIYRRVHDVPIDRLESHPLEEAGRRAGERRHLSEDLNAVGRLGAFWHVSLRPMRDLIGQDHRQLRFIPHAGEQARMDVHDGAAARERVDARVSNGMGAVAEGSLLGDGDDSLDDLGEVGLKAWVVPHRCVRLKPSIVALYQAVVGLASPLRVGSRVPLGK